MSPLTKAFVVLATLLSVVMVSLTVAHVARTENYRAMFKDLQTDRDDAVARSAQNLAQKANELADSNTDASKLETDLADVRGDLTQLRGDLRAKDERIASLEANLARMTAANSALSATLTSSNGRLESQDEQIRTLIGNIADLGRQRGELEQAIAVALAARDRYANEVRRLSEALEAEEAERAAVETERARLATLVETLLPNVEDTITLTEPTVPIEGAVTNINQFGEGLTLVGVNVGTRDGVRVNMPFRLSRGDQYIGTIKITRVDTDQSVGEVILMGGSGEAIRSGDAANAGNRN